MMKVLIDIPEEYELDYKTDRFSEFFQRCRADMDVCCGTYERETSDMLEKVFNQSEIIKETVGREKDKTKMNEYKCDVEKYVVHYGKNVEDQKKRAFDDAECAIEFAREQMNKGLNATIKQISELVGWY